jgi:hypothetical protein
MPSRQIGRVMGRADRTVCDYIDRMKQRPPLVRARASMQLTLAEREEILRGLATGSLDPVDRVGDVEVPLDGVS